MNRVGSGTRCNVEDFLNVQVGLGGSRGTDMVSLVRFANMQRGAIDVGINRDGGDSHLVARADDADSNLSPICDENLFEHGSVAAAPNRAGWRGQTAYCTGERAVQGVIRRPGWLLRAHSMI
jgi:hypothetical protein